MEEGCTFTRGPFIHLTQLCGLAALPPCPSHPPAGLLLTPHGRLPRLRMAESAWWPFQPPVPKSQEEDGS